MCLAFARYMEDELIGGELARADVSVAALCIPHMGDYIGGMNSPD